MVQRYSNTSGEESALLDTMLCEYVDGTIDQVVRAAFDDCMSTDKSLRERVECLMRTRRLLRQHRCRETRGIHLRVRERLCRELSALQQDGVVLRSLGPFAGAGVALGILLCATLISGANRTQVGTLGSEPNVVQMGELPMTPLRGPAPEIPVRLAHGPPLMAIETAAQTGP